MDAKITPEAGGVIEERPADQTVHAEMRREMLGDLRRAERLLIRRDHLSMNMDGGEDVTRQGRQPVLWQQLDGRFRKGRMGR